MKKRVILFYGFSVFSFIAVLLWILEMIKGAFTPEETGPFCLALLCAALFFALGKRASKKASDQKLPPPEE